ncbi:ATP-grasp fold amidoligase family protein [Butyricimonas paravirosa]|uniref:ATP-grasp fold amidoligase family protein n=1 Tax=Butyricimonas paravirosa TaxID=1472417 RepID=UPI0022DFF95D|nr:ATP-grasp fold amidoligase family protein [Butyricimonas paravirosa]
MRTFRNTLRDVFYFYAKIACKVAPYILGPLLAKREYRRIMGKKMNLKNPRNLVEKIVWLQFHADTALWTQCADKYRVRDYVESKGLGGILPKLYGCWKNVDEINFDELPKSFVLKTNNSCGQLLIVQDKRNLNIEEAKKKLRKWLKMSYGYHNAQLHYIHIEPCIIAEEFLVDLSLKPGENLIDYKVWCFHGKPESILVINGRSNNEYYMEFYDTQWQNISDMALNPNSSHFGSRHTPCPNNLDLMLKYARQLSEEFAEVRVDFYNFNGNIYFGELTFTAGYGNYSNRYYDYLGSKIDLAQIKRIR